MWTKNFERSKSSGFSLLEVLIAVLVLAVGLLGVAALQLNGLKNNQSALQRSLATALAYSMMDSMRANRTSALAGAYNMSKTCTPPSGGTLVQNDKRVWIETLRFNLGDVDSTCGEVSCAGSVCAVKVYWDDSRGSAGNAAQVIEVKSRL
ncbi:MAG: type IV pilus modification protein PilV [Rhodocyclales bacterium]|nr:type IV pilus modification protein PilV [Rhodocyclales bacterium]